MCIPKTSMLVLIFVLAGSVHAADKTVNQETAVGLTGVTSTLATVLSRVDVDAVQSVVSTNAVKGGVGESYMDRYFTRSFRASSDWHPVRSRIGPQGIDGLYVKYNRQGGIHRVMVAEAKYGSSRLAMTKDGIQMGNRWTSRRLSAMGDRYSRLGRIAKSGSMVVQKVRSPSAQLLQIPLRDGKAAVFWRATRLDSWKFAGPSHRLIEAGDAAAKIGNRLVVASERPASYSRLVYRIRMTPEGLDIVIKDASKIDVVGSESRLPVTEKLAIRLSNQERSAISRMTKTEVQTLLRKKFPNMSKASVNGYAESISRSPRRLNELFTGRTRSIPGKVAGSSFLTAGIASALAVGLQVGGNWYAGKQIDWVETGELGALVFGGTALGTATGQQVLFVATRNPTLQTLAKQASRRLSFASASTLTRGVSGLVGGGVGVVVISSGGYLLGYCDAEHALRGGLAGFAGLGAGFVFSSTTLGLVGAFGTASTGTAISSLGGAAATNATMAWLGGGSLAAGGGGVAAGGIVLTGGVIIVAVAASAIVMKGFQLYDARQDSHRIKLTIDWLRNKYGRMVTQKSDG